MNKIYNPDRKDWLNILKRPTQTVSDIEDVVNEVFAKVEMEGDSVLMEYTQKFDGVNLKSLQVSESEIAEAADLVGQELKTAIALAKRRFCSFVFHNFNVGCTRKYFRMFRDSFMYTTE